MPAKAAPKLKKAMDKPPAAATRSHDAYPGEHLGTRSNSSRQRAVESFDGGEGDSDTKATDSKAAKSKQPKPALGSDHTKPSKVDGHPVETEKTHPGGDMIEVEPSETEKPGKTKKNRKTKGEGSGSKTAKGGNRGSDSADQDAAFEATAASKPKKTKKGDKSGDPKVDPTKAKAKAKALKSNKVDMNGEADVTGENVKTSAPEPVKKAAKPKKAAKGAEKNVEHAGTHTATDGTVTTPSNEKAKPTNEKDDSAGAEIGGAPDTTMDQSVFENLLSTDKGKQHVSEEEDEAPKAKAKPPKAAKKVAKDQAKGATSSKADTKVSKKGKDIDKADADQGAPASKSRKRKLPANGDVDDVKTDVLDPLSEIASAKKKQKKNRSGSNALGVASDTLGSVLSSVKQTAKAAIGVADKVVGDGQSSIMGDVTTVAEGVVEGKGKKKKSHAVEEKLPSEESLLKGMESSGDEKDPAEDEGFENGQLPPPVPESTLNRINEISTSDAGLKSDEGVIYVGRIPHGFYEHEMRAYFSQFGHINRLRLSRNKTTGASRHYAFIEFDSKEVANIVAETMNNYLLFGHILKVKSLDASRIDSKIWKGANRRFKKVPWAQIEGRKLAMPMSREQWEKRVEREQTRREKKVEKMKEIGYEFESSLTNVDQVPVKDGKREIDTGVGGTVVAEEQTLVTEPGEEGGSMMIKESTVTKKVRKPSAKAKEIEDSKEATAAAGKKGKRKAEEVLEKAKESTDIAEPVPKKVKKAKAKADKITDEVNDTTKDGAAPAGDKVKKTGQKAYKKAKESVEKAGPVVEEAKKNAQETFGEPKKATEEVVASATKDSKKASEEITDKAKAAASPIARKGKEAASIVSETTAAVTGKPKKGKKTKA